MSLERFLTAQDAVWDAVISELTAGQKRTHWMWFVFPQLAALGRSPTAKFYGITGLDEANAYLCHPVLGARLTLTSSLMLDNSIKGAQAILGPVDALKLRSSMTLFSQIGGSPDLYKSVLTAFYSSPDDATLALL